MRFATDTGGTFTDLIVEDDAGHLHLFKAPTVPNEPVRGVLAAFDVAAKFFGLARADLLAKGSTFIHGTTHAVNAIITKTTARTALLITQGHPDILVLREGGRIEPFNHAAAYPDPYIPRALTFEVGGRIIASGAERTEFNKQGVLDIIQKLKENRVEAVSVCLLWSVINPDHENRVGSLLAEHLPGVPVTLSHQLNPSIREYRRAIASSIDASLKPLMNRYLGGLTTELRKAGFSGNILVLSSQGGMVDADEVKRTPILAINSGPSMAPIAGGRLAASESDARDVIIYDTGGTTFDVSVVRDGRVPFTQETWMGRPHQSDMTGFPSVDVKSIGAGGGSIAWLDDGGVLHVGPQSAGAVPGPACYGAGGNYATVTDAALILGYIDPRFFLGGSMELDRSRSEEVIMRDVAIPMNVSLEAGAAAILEVWTENMVQAIADITVNQGINPETAVLVAGGGAGGLNAVAIAQRMQCISVIVPEVGAALSAAGAIASDIARDYRQIFFTTTENFDVAGAIETIESLHAKAQIFINGAKLDPREVNIEFTIEARYPHQVWEIEVVINPATLKLDNVQLLIEEKFHVAHERLFAFSDPGSAVEIIAWRVVIRGQASRNIQLRLAASKDSNFTPHTRDVYFPRIGWTQTQVWRFDSLEPGRYLRGPAIVESPFTAIVIEPGTEFERTVCGNLLARKVLVNVTGEQTKERLVNER
jgi:N-methylhydantoinase A